MPLDTGEVLLAFPADVGPVRHVRSTLLLGSLAALEEAGHIDAWSAVIAPDAREQLQHAVAGVWLDVDLALTHYRACERLALSSETQAELGAATFGRLRGTLLGTMLRMAQGSGATPWTVLPHLQRFWNRAYDGGGIRVVRLGPKDAQLDLIECAFADTRYYRNALRGLVRGVLELFSRKAYVHERVGRRAAGALSLHGQWV